MLLMCNFPLGYPCKKNLPLKITSMRHMEFLNLFFQIPWVPSGFTEYVSAGGRFFFHFPDPEATLVGFLLLLHFGNKISQTLELHWACSHRRGPSAIKHRSRDLAALPVSLQQADKEKKKYRKSVLTEVCIMEPSLHNSSSTPSCCAVAKTPPAR